MRRQGYVLFAMLSCTVSVSNLSGQTNDSILEGTIYVSKYPTEVYYRVQSDESQGRMAQFPGGDEALKEFIRRNRRSFWSKRFRSGSDSVILTVEVDTFGRLSDPQLVHWPFVLEYSDEALRLLTLMPEWEPALDANGNKQPSRVALSISFPGYRSRKK